MDNIQDNIQEKANELQGKFQETQERVENTVGKAKEAFQTNVAEKFPVTVPPSVEIPPSSVSPHATVHELKSRLNWGEPGLTIVDVRDRDAFDDYRILGAVNAPVAELSDPNQFGLQRERDIYVYSDSDGDTASAAASLREAGFRRVAELQGGLNAWKEIGGSIDGTQTSHKPGPGAYNVVSRLKEFAEERAKERSMQ